MVVINVYTAYYKYVALTKLHTRYEITSMKLEANNFRVLLVIKVLFYCF